MVGLLLRAEDSACFLRLLLPPPDCWNLDRLKRWVCQGLVSWAQVWAWLDQGSWAEPYQWTAGHPAQIWPWANGIARC
jgi:hypothetical protein